MSNEIQDKPFPYYLRASLALLSFIYVTILFLVHLYKLSTREEALESERKSSVSSIHVHPPPPTSPSSRSGRHYPVKKHAPYKCLKPYTQPNQKREKIYKGTFYKQINTSDAIISLPYGYNTCFHLLSSFRDDFRRHTSICRFFWFNPRL